MKVFTILGIVTVTLLLAGVCKGKGEKEMCCVDVTNKCKRLINVLVGGLMCTEAACRATVAEARVRYVYIGNSHINVDNVGIGLGVGVSGGTLIGAALGRWCDGNAEAACKAAGYGAMLGGSLGCIIGAFIP